MLSHGGLDYAYDGLGNRISQDNGTDVTKYLLDLQSGLPKVLSETVGANVTRFVHSPRGLHATQNPADAWFYSLQDGLGSQRAEIGANVDVVGSQEFTPYGVAQNVTGSFSSPHAFTGEPLDTNGLQYHRARYYDPAMGVWASLDPAETPNRYSYVSGNPTNLVDPTGLQGEEPIMIVPPMSSCHRLVTNGLNQGGLQEFMQSNNLSRKEDAITLLQGSWNDCWCELYDLYGVKTEADSAFATVHSQMMGLRSDIESLILSSNSTCGLEEMLTRTYRYKHPSSCQRKQEPEPTLGGAGGNCNLNLHELDVKTQGNITGFTAFAGIGGGLSIMELWEIETGRYMRFFVPEFGAGLGADLNLLGTIITGGATQRIWSESTLDEIAWSTSNQESVTLGIFISSVSNDLSYEGLYTPPYQTDEEYGEWLNSVPCPDLTTSDGRSLGLEVAFTITGAWVNYDSNWER